jgi:hypothetical protein
MSRLPRRSLVRWPAVPWLRLRAGAAYLAVSLTGLALGLYLFAATSVDVGPFRSTLTVSPSLSGGTEVDLPPSAHCSWTAIAARHTSPCASTPSTAPARRP